MSCRVVMKTVSKSGALPSYLDRFETDKVLLIFAKKPSLTSDSEAIFPEGIKEDIEHDESNEKFDLTGDPLKVDLGGDESIQAIKAENIIERWSTDELRHFPLPVREARREINRMLKKASNHSSPIYIICNADDSKKTVLLGGNKSDWMACSIHALGLLSQQDVHNKIQEMVDDHLRNCYDNNCNSQVEYLVKITYNLYGKTLRHLSCQNAMMRELSIHGHIYVEIVSPKKLFKMNEIDKGQMKLHLEVVAGHNHLAINFLWKELLKLQTLIDILSDSELSNCDETIICTDPLDPDVILQGIIELISSKFLKRERKKDVVDLNDLRQADLLDGLWDILSCCENVSVLRTSFNFLFEELAEGIIKILPIKDNCSKISAIIKGISQGKIGLSAISLPESIELLFELGAQKLKFDFQVILTQCTPHNKTTIDSVWKVFSQNEQEAKKLKETRATRMTNLLGTRNLTIKINQLAYLGQLYIGCEFIYLLKDKVKLSDEGVSHFYRCVEMEYVSNSKKIIDFNEIYQSPLNEMSLELDLRNASEIESVLPSRWTICMKTGRESTIFDLSDSPIFPPVIYDYGVPVPSNDDDLTYYYVSKMSRSAGLF